MILPNTSPVKELLEQFGKRPVLFATSERDWGGNHHPTEDAQTFAGYAKGDKMVNIWPGEGHGGEEIFQNNKEAMASVISWYEKYLIKI